MSKQTGSFSPNLKTPEPSRRQFLKSFLSGAAATAVLPIFGLHAQKALSSPLPVIPTPVAGDAANEAFWYLVKNQFPIKPGLIIMNAANLCPSSYPVMETVFQLTRNVDSDVSYQNRGKFRDLHDKGLTMLGEYLGCGANEIVITRNTSEGNGVVINGLDLKAGDEVVIWDENHPTNNVAWEVAAQRYGYRVKKVRLPNHPASDDDLIKPFIDAFTRNTKVVAFSHVSNLTGVGVPAKELCRMAQERGILSHIDGAQTFGALSLDLHEIGCDFFTGSAHKWFVGPKETGILYVRKDRVDKLWPNLVGVGWKQSKDNAARKFSTLGQRDDAAVSAMAKTVEFHNHLGRERVEARIRELVGALRQGIRKNVPSAEFVTPEESRYNAGVLVFELPGIDLSNALATLYENHHIGCTVRRGKFIRFCPHIYNTMDEVEKVVAAVRSLI